MCMGMCGLASRGAAQKTLFYMQENAASVHSFEQHRDKIDILVPTWYAVNGHGLVSGEPDERVLSEAKAAHVQVIPIIVRWCVNAGSMGMPAFSLIWSMCCGWSAMGSRRW